MRTLARDVSTGGRHHAVEDERHLSRKAAAVAARTGSGPRATSSVRGAARIAISSARRSARTTATPRSSTSSPPSRTRCTARAIWTAESRPGTRARSRSPRQHTGARSRIPSRSRGANGRTRSTTTPAGTAAANVAIPVEAHNLRVARLGRTRRSVEPLTARRGLSRANGYRRRSEPITAATRRHADGRDGDRSSLLQYDDAHLVHHVPAQHHPAGAIPAVRRAHQIRVTGVQNVAESVGRPPAIHILTI